MLFSIITVNYNNKAGLENTIKSVVAQTYRDFEFIVIDGASTDGSKGIVKYKELFSYYVSEPDTGVYNAMNKGIKASNGEYLLFLNSGDLFYNEKVLSSVGQRIDKGFDLFYGNEMDVGNRINVQPKELPFSYFYDSSLRHQATFIKRTLFDKVFYYNEDLKIVSDWEFMICSIYKYSASFKYIDLIISIYEGDGISRKMENRGA